MKLKRIAFVVAAAGALIAGQQANAQLQVSVNIENIGPANGVAITPVWVGFHDGSFDSYDGGSSAAGFIESLAEDGDNGPISTEFNMVAGRVDGNVGSPTGPPPLSAGESAAQLFTIATDSSNRYFSYGSMVLPSNDFFLANGNPVEHDLMSLLDGVGTVSFLIGQPGTVNDAGTEEEDFDTVAPATGPLQDVLFPGRGFAVDAGQTGPNQGAADATTTIQTVGGADPYAGFANINGADLSGFDFNDASLYSGGGIARVTITAIPEPNSIALVGLGIVGLCGLRRRMK